MSPPGFTILRADWERDWQTIRALRATVFVVEQGIDAELEWDGMDKYCLHSLALAPDGEVIGTGRLQPDGRIGRMAVRKAWRNKGVGTALLEHLVCAARDRGDHNVWLSAQARAVSFYVQHGFTSDGDSYLEAGIPHQKMLRMLIQ